jgi:hypothetical protein
VYCAKKLHDFIFYKIRLCYYRYLEVNPEGREFTDREGDIIKMDYKMAGCKYCKLNCGIQSWVKVTR